MHGTLDARRKNSARMEAGPFVRRLTAITQKRSYGMVGLFHLGLSNAHDFRWLQLAVSPTIFTEGIGVLSCPIM